MCWHWVYKWQSTFESPTASSYLEWFHGKYTYQHGPKDSVNELLDRRIVVTVWKKKIGSASMLIVCLSHNDRFIGSFIHSFYECVSNVMWHFTFFFSLASINLSFCDICGLFWRHLLFKLFNLNLSIYLFDWFVSVEKKKKHLKLWPIQFSKISVIYRKFPITVKILLWNTEKNKTQRLNKIL